MMQASSGPTRSRLSSGQGRYSMSPARRLDRWVFNPGRHAGRGCTWQVGMQAMASVMIRSVAMALVVVAIPLMPGSGQGVATADEYLDPPAYLMEGWTLNLGWVLGGYELGAFDLHLQHDCNLVLYPYASLQNPRWASNTAGKAQNCTLIMQSDCNAVLYETGTQNALWASETAGKGRGCALWVQNDGNVVIYDAAGVAVWSTGTAALP